jgi:hypothetical protein
MEGIDQISQDVTKFTKGCESLLAVLAQKAQLTDMEKRVITYYCQEILDHTQTLRAEVEKV